MSEIKCSCGTVSNFSIHGSCTRCGKSCPRPYNGSTKEPQTPTTTRGKRRQKNKKS